MFGLMLKKIRNLSLGGQPVIFDFPVSNGKQATLTAEKVPGRKYLIKLIFEGRERSGVGTFDDVVKIFSIAAGKRL